MKTTWQDIAAGAGGFITIQLPTSTDRNEVWKAEGMAAEMVSYWSALANQRGHHLTWSYTAGDIFNPADVLSFAELVLDLSEEAEGSIPPPNAGARIIEYHGGYCGIELTWDGTWTAGRWVRITIDPPTTDEPGSINFAWCSGTGRPSNFLDVDDLFARVAPPEDWVVNWGDEVESAE